MVSAWQAVLLGLVQGLTEFLPVSSSGHLVIAQALLGLEEPMITFDIFVHVGTLVAVFSAFWADIWAILRRPFRKLTALLVVGTIPAALAGFFLEDFFAALFSSLVAVSLALILTGLLLLISDKCNGQGRLENMGFGAALIVGLCQAAAITPGLSRSGSTIFGALVCGLRREDAARFSFLLSIPVILGAALLQAHHLAAAGQLVLHWTYFLGALVAGLSGYVAIRLFLKLLARQSLRYFSYYCWALALIVLASQLLGR